MVVLIAIQLHLPQTDEGSCATQKFGFEFPIYDKNYGEDLEASSLLYRCSSLASNSDWIAEAY